jgi:nucleoside-diphosphate kinase
MQNEAFKRGDGMDRTFGIIKPDGIVKGLIGEILKRIAEEHLSILALKMVHLDPQKAKGFYAAHRGKPFFNTLIDFMCSGPCVLMILEGRDAIMRWRNLMGSTDPSKAAQGSIRADFGTSIEKNVVHGSDSPETAAQEINYFYELRPLAINPEKVWSSGSKK